MMNAKEIPDDISREEVARNILEEYGVKIGEEDIIETETNKSIGEYVGKMGSFTPGNRIQILDCVKHSRAIGLREAKNGVEKRVLNLFVNQLTNEQLSQLGIDVNEIAGKIAEETRIKFHETLK